MMNAEFLFGWLLIGAGVYCVSRARSLDRELLGLLPPRVERRWQEREWLDRRDWGVISPPIVTVHLPARWQRHLHADRGAALVDRFMLFAGVGLWCTYIGVALVWIAVQTAVSG